MDDPSRKSSISELSESRDIRSIVQFASDTVFFKSTDGLVEIDVLRIGETIGEVSVDYTTEMGSASPGTHYSEAKGTVVFGPGEYVQPIRIRVFKSDVWRPTLNFRIHLVSLHGDQAITQNVNLGGISGNSFKACRVWILHEGSFPTKAVEDDEAASLPAHGSQGSKTTDALSHAHHVALAVKIKLLSEFFRKCFNIDIVRRGTLKILAVDMLDNLLYLWQLVLFVYFVDHVVEVSPEGAMPLGLSRVQLAIAVGLAHALPMVLVNHLKEAKAWYGVGGAARKQLQVDLLRRYLFFTDQSRKKVGAAGFIEALYRDSVEVVDQGYMQALEGAAALGKIACILLFTMLRTPYVLPLQLALCCFTVLRMYAREEVATLLRLKYFQAQNRMLEHADNVTRLYPLIRDCTLKPAMSRKMEQIVDDVNYFANAVSAHTARSKLALPFASACIAGGLMASTPSALDTLPGLTAGLLIAMIESSKSMGLASEALFGAMLSIQLSISALLKIMTYVNMETDAAEEMLACDKQRDRGRKIAQDASLQKDSRKADEKWLKKLGLSMESLAAPSTDPNAQDARTSAADAMLIEMIGVSLVENEGDTPQLAKAQNATRRLSMRIVAPQAIRAKRLSASGHQLPGAPHLQTRSREHMGARDVSQRVAANTTLRDVNFQLKQGHVYAVVGPHAGGKSYFLRLLAKAMHPTAGEVFVPSHLSIKHVEQTPQLFPGLTLYENLVLGLEQKDWPPIESVAKVAEALGLTLRWLNFLRSQTPRWIMQATRRATPAGAVRAAAPPGDYYEQLVEEEEDAHEHAEWVPKEASQWRPKDAELAADVEVKDDSGDGMVYHGEQQWESQLSTSDRHIIHLARAIIANPQFLLLHRPVAAYERTLGCQIMEVLTRFVRERGSSVLMDQQRGHLARTVIFTCSLTDEHALDHADGVIVLGRPAGGATVMDTNLLYDPTRGETKGASLSRQCAALIPRVQDGHPHHRGSDAAATHERSRPQLPAPKRPSADPGDGGDRPPGAPPSGTPPASSRPGGVWRWTPSARGNSKRTPRQAAQL